VTVYNYKDEEHIEQNDGSVRAGQSHPMKESEAAPPAAEEPSGECNFRIPQSTLTIFYRYVPPEKRSAWIDQAILERIDRELQCLMTPRQFEERVRGIVMGTDSYRVAPSNFVQCH
jgi:hypothetical protein